MKIGLPFARDPRIRSHADKRRPHLIPVTGVVTHGPFFSQTIPCNPRISFSWKRLLLMLSLPTHDGEASSDHDSFPRNFICPQHVMNFSDS